MGFRYAGVKGVDAKDLEIEAVALYSDAVSYTHLDVYKRQGLLSFAAYPKKLLRQSVMYILYTRYTENTFYIHHSHVYNSCLLYTSWFFHLVQASFMCCITFSANGLAAGSVWLLALRLFMRMVIR